MVDMCVAVTPHPSHHETLMQEPEAAAAVIAKLALDEPPRPL